MRIITGRLGGRTVEPPHGHRTHPMGDKVRGGLFNALGDISGLTVLDVFAGSGALSIEAISRGAKSAVAIDSDKEANRAMVKNATKLGIVDQMQIVHSHAMAWSSRNWKRQYDLVLFDPPYDDVQYKTMEKLAARHCVAEGLLVFSVPPNTRIILPEDQFEVVANKSYGDATLIFYRRIS